MQLSAVGVRHDCPAACGAVQAWAGVDVAALAQYLTHTLRSGQAFDLLLLKELVSVMTVRRWAWGLAGDSVWAGNAAGSACMCTCACLLM